MAGQKGVFVGLDGLSLLVQNFTALLKAALLSIPQVVLNLQALNKPQEKIMLFAVFVSKPTSTILCGDSAAQ